MITRLARPSLTCFVEHPFGLTLGAVGDDATHRRVLDAVLGAATGDYPTGTVVDLGIRWTLDDLRERQLRKEA
ncbi:MAG: hypothetical protein U0838_02755 [Chloroflexota bacterium]